jgi:cell fate (sporulation/competence/biofilm development) regulator YlbF (YheA/YmcA/DUF963 family)
VGPLLMLMMNGVREIDMSETTKIEAKNFHALLDECKFLVDFIKADTTLKQVISHLTLTIRKYEPNYNPDHPLMRYKNVNQ